MGINRTLFAEIESLLSNYGCSEDGLREFMTLPWDFLRRQEKAIQMVEQIMIRHGKSDLLHHVVELARIEHGIRELEPRVRDHVVHALLSFALGVYVNERFLRPSGHGVDRFQWKLAGLFHDIGYPAQVAKDILRPFTDHVNQIKRDLDVEVCDVFFRVIPVGLERLASGANSLDLIQEWLDRWGLDINARAEYDSMLETGEVCHGIISSLAVLYVVALMYRRYNRFREYRDIYEPRGVNWNQSYFENHVTPACAAIFVHNLPPRCFVSTRIDPMRAPLPFLLKLSDCLQDWDRPSAEVPCGISDNQYDIACDATKVIFTAHQPDRRDQIADEIAASLVSDDIEIR